MSLINEALKRTRDASLAASSLLSAPPPEYRLGHSGGLTSFAAKSAIAVVVLVIVAAVATVGVIALRVARPIGTIEQRLESVSRGTEVSSPAAPASASASAQLPAGLPAHPAGASGDKADTTPTPSAPAAVEQKPAAVASKAEPAVSQEQLVAQVLEKLKAQQTAESAPVQAPPPEPPKLVLQGITSQGNAREVMINGYTLREGEDIEGARVIAIDARTVKMQFGGRDFVLRMP